MRGLNGHHVIVTGGTGLLGEAIVHRLVREGASVTVTSRERARAEAWIDEQPYLNSDRLHPMGLDLASEDSIDAAIEHLRAADEQPNVLIANASLRDGLDTPFGELTHEHFERLFAVDVAGHFLFARDLVEAYEQPPASIVFLSSVYSTIGVDGRLYPDGMAPTPPQYAATKAGLNGLVRYLAARWGSDTRVNGVVAGGVRNETRQNDTFVEKYNRKTMLGRMATPDEIASAVAFLASDDASYITGECLTVDGGMSYY